tara:strand:- start:913 stop:1143 length:231 start_codon:yes stop_codon:yes gene_type:complete
MKSLSSTVREEIEETVYTMEDTMEMLKKTSTDLTRLHAHAKEIERQLSTLDYDSTDPYDPVESSLRLLEGILDATA